MNANQADFPIANMCNTFNVSKSGYYDWQEWPVSKTAAANTVLVEQIRAAYQISDATYGMPRIRAELANLGITASRTRIAHLLTRKPGVDNASGQGQGQGLTPAQSFIHHSDQGSQYTSLAFGGRCKAMNVRTSMGTVKDAYDNAMADSFFASLECELIDSRVWQTKTQARLDVFTWIEA